MIVPDLRGHGWTEAPEGGYEKEQLASDLLALLDALGVERVTWVGHDWGGWIGFLAAMLAPERFERMLALCIPHPWVSPDPRRLALLAYQGPISLPLIGGRVAGPMSGVILQTGREGDRLRTDEVKLFAGHIPGSVTVAMYRTFLTREMLPIARGRYAGRVLDVPTTLLIRADDAVTTGTRAGAVDGQRQLQVATLEGVGHWVPEQRPGP